MGRKKNELAGHDKPFAQRLRALLSGKDGNDATEEEVKENTKCGEINKLANAIGVDRTMISRYYKGSIPDTPQLVQIAKYYHVSADWLLGFQEVRTIKPDIKMIARVTGLSDKSIKALNQLHFGKTERAEYETLEDCLENQEMQDALSPDGQIDDIEFKYHTQKIKLLPNAHAIEILNYLLEYDYDYNIGHSAWDPWEDKTILPSVLDALYKAVFPQSFIPRGLQKKDPEYAEFLAEKDMKKYIRDLRIRHNKEYGADGKEYRMKMELEEFREGIQDTEGPNNEED